MYVDRKEARVVLSVRELCMLALAGGSLDNRRPPQFLSLRAAEGREVHDAIRAHRMQGDGLDLTNYGEGSTPVTPSDLPAGTYHPEVTLRHVAKVDGVVFAVSGRADGVWYDPAGGCVVEEIKSVTGNAAYYVDSPRTLDLAQLVCYGYFLAAAKNLPTVTLRLTYARPGHEADAAYADSLRTADQLRDAYGDLLAAILPRAKDLVERETTVRAAAKEALFPYPEMRDAQRDMILECWRDMRAGKTLFAQAPTGIGKTIATLYPAVRCFGENRCDKIFYLTAKNATRREAFGAMQKLTEAGLPLRACVITARESVCLCEGAKAAQSAGRRLSAHCNPIACPYARGYYDRIESVISGLLASGRTLFSGLDIRTAAKDGCVCPYELALDLSERCEVIICDYNYVFSPAVSLRRYFADGLPGTEGHRYIFLVDEAHNLPDRARDMYSGLLSLADVLAVQDALHVYETRAADGVFPDEDFTLDAPFGDEADDIPASAQKNRLSSASLDDLVGALSRMADTCRDEMVTDRDGVRRGAVLDRSEPAHLVETARTLSLTLDRWLRKNELHSLAAVIDKLAGSLHAFRTAADYFDRSFVTFTEVEGDDVRVRLICLDAAGILRPILHKAVARVLFSATLTPADYFADILGGDRESVLVSFDSPFPPGHLAVAICPQVNTRFEERDTSYRRIVSYIAATVSARAGNYMIYFPSYAYLEQVYRRFVKKYPTIRTVLQTPGMTYTEREAFIASFTADTDTLRVGFCVLGGSFSEGVDLPGRCLIGAIIVGVGIPGLSDERNMIRAHFDEREQGEGAGQGYAYAYTYPGMNHVLQAAGRVIRRPEDYGVVVLLDDRYTVEPYTRLYPDHWDNIAAVEDAASLYDHLSAFWDEADDEIFE